MRALDMFSGTGSVAKVLRSEGYECDTLDLQGDPTFRCSILDFEYW